MRAQAGPLLFGELHAAPVIEARGVLHAELDAPGLGGAGFGGGDVRLKFYGAGSGACGGVDVGVRRAQAAIVRLGDFGDDQAAGHGYTVSAKVFSMRRK